MMPNSKRFFSADSFWNTPIGSDPVVDERSDDLIKLLRDALTKRGRNGFWINHDYWTIPVYEANQATPLRRVAQRVVRPGEMYLPRTGFRHGPGFGPEIPVPEGAVPAREADGHLAIVDRERGIGWDMWAARWREDGELESFTGMTYRLDGSGVRPGRADRPNGLIVTDDNLLPAVGEGLVQAGVRVPDDLRVVVMTNFPNRVPCATPVTRIGYDIPALLDLLVLRLEQVARGETPPEHRAFPAIPDPNGDAG
jgi:hypothetical protein